MKRDFKVSLSPPPRIPPISLLHSTVKGGKSGCARQKFEYLAIRAMRIKFLCSLMVLRGRGGIHCGWRAEIVGAPPTEIESVLIRPILSFFRVRELVRSCC